MNEASLELWEQLDVLHQALDEAQVPRAFGGRSLLLIAPARAAPMT